MHAVILAGGKGIRLHPYTTCIPKPLVPLGDELSVLELLLLQLRSHGFESATLAVGHLGHLIESFAGDGSRWGVALDYAEETSPLGTMGPLLMILDRLPEQFLVMNGDVLTDLAYRDLMDRHEYERAPMTVAVHNRSVAIDFGVLETRAEHVVAFREKPTFGYNVSMGVYALSRETLRPFQPGLPLGFDDLIVSLMSRSMSPLVYEHSGYWMDIGRPEDYDTVNRDFAEIRKILLPQASHGSAA